MPETFLDVERRKSRVIAGLLVFLAGFYFLTAAVLWAVVAGYFRYHSTLPFRIFTLSSLSWIMLGAGLVAFLHWNISTANLMERMTRSLGASDTDPEDGYHHMFSNIVSEVSAAMGNARPLRAQVIPEASLNAFALEDLEGNAVVGVTEGLLARLSRSQLTAVVGHEVAHIISGDCFTTTIVSSLSELYRESLVRVEQTLRGVRSRASGVLVLVYAVLWVDNLLCGLLAMFISRQKEYRADAVSVRLTREPLALAQALTLISRSWKGQGSDGSRLESVFIISPRADSLNEREGFVADLFSTHPPVRRRIAALLDMAHAGEDVLERSLESLVRTPPCASVVQVPGLSVPGAGESSVCPACAASLQRLQYEGTPIWECGACAGVFVPVGEISRILIRRDVQPDEKVQRFAKQLCAGYNKYREFKRQDVASAWTIGCPKCHGAMKREFFQHSYPVEVEHCYSCGGIWLDRMALEALQYIYEHKEECLYGEKNNAEQG